MMVFMCFRADTPYELRFGLGSASILGVSRFTRGFLRETVVRRRHPRLANPVSSRDVIYGATSDHVSKLVKCTTTSSIQHGHSDSEGGSRKAAAIGDENP